MTQANISISYKSSQFLIHYYQISKNIINISGLLSLDSKLNHSSVYPPHKVMLSLSNCRITVQFLKIYSFVSFTLAAASSNARFANSRAFSVYPHLSYKNTDMFKCRLILTSLVGGKLLLASESASS